MHSIIGYVTSCIFMCIVLKMCFDVKKLKSILGMPHCASGRKSRPPVDIVEG